MQLKEVDDVLGGDEMWKHADSTTGMFVIAFGRDFDSDFLTTVFFYCFVLGFGTLIGPCSIMSEV